MAALPSSWRQRKKKKMLSRHLPSLNEYKKKKNYKNPADAILVLRTFCLWLSSLLHLSDVLRTQPDIGSNWVESGGSTAEKEAANRCNVALWWPMQDKSSEANQCVLSLQRTPHLSKLICAVLSPNLIKNKPCIIETQFSFEKMIIKKNN